MQNVLEFKKTHSDSKGKLNWDTIIPLIIFHAFAVWALFYFSWANLAAAVLMWWIAGSFGIGLGYHRMLTHGGFKSPKWFEYFLTVCGTFALQSSAIKWVTTHRLHHAFTETEKDPHSPRHSAYWAHMGWIVRGTSQEHDPATFKKYVPDLLKDRFHVLLSNYYYVPTVIAGVAIFFVGGWSMVLWAIFLRTVFGWHMTWLVNSATHLWGTRRFETRDDSTNNGLVALFTFGEGWHNNHHAQPSSARHGLAWYEFDINWIQIRLFERLGLVRDVKVYKLNQQPAELKQAA